VGKKGRGRVQINRKKTKSLGLNAVGGPPVEMATQTKFAGARKREGRTLSIERPLVGEKRGAWRTDIARPQIEANLQNIHYRGKNAGGVPGRHISGDNLPKRGVKPIKDTWKIAKSVKNFVFGKMGEDIERNRSVKSKLDAPA